MKTICISILLIWLSAFSVFTQTTGKEIMKKYKSQMLSKDQAVNITMKIINKKGRERVRQIIRISKTDTQENVSQMIQFKAPADIEGTSFLSIEYSDRQDDRWLYLPALRRTRRISSSNKSDQFMSSDFTYEDIEPEKIDDFDYKLLGEETVDNEICYQIEAKPNNQKTKDESGYSKRIIMIDKDQFINRKTIYFDNQGTKIKILENKDFCLINNTKKWRPNKMEMNVINAGKTILLYSNYQINKGIEPNFFTKSNLEKDIK